MANLDQSQFQILHCAEHTPCTSHFKFRGLGRALLVFSVALCCLQIACAQPQSNATQTEASGVHKSKADLEVEKLELENTKLREVHGEWLTWLPALIGLLIAAVSIPASIWSARLARANALDQATHEKRLESYPQLVKAMSPLALYFPVAICFPSGDPNGAASISPSKCGAMGHEMSKWYFEGGGLLMSIQARDAYFRLARALTLASRTPDLKVPSFPGNAVDISKEKIDGYRRQLEQQMKLDFNDIENWEFGGSRRKAAGSTDKAEQFKDYVFLQQLSSYLRTMLSDDLSSRGRPA